MTLQEMFDKAWRGLAAQEWRIAIDPDDDACVYLAPNGDRCAWGHVDTSLTAKSTGTVYAVGGLASSLDEASLAFARNLQRCHDSADGPDDMQRRLRNLAEAHNLTIPEVST